MFGEWCRERVAILIDNLEIENIDEVLDPGLSGESMALAAEMKIGINQYLRELISSPVRSLADIIAYNEKNFMQVIKANTA